MCICEEIECGPLYDVGKNHELIPHPEQCHFSNKMGDKVRIAIISVLDWTFRNGHGHRFMRPVPTQIDHTHLSL